MRIAIYARVSTSDQARGLEGQLDQLRAYAAARGAEAAEFIDETSGAARAKRPAFDRLMEAVHRREVDAVACVRLDRLARSVGHLVAICGDLEARGVALVVLEQAIDTATSAGRFMFHTLAAVAQLERDLIRERTRAGLAAARRRGQRLGRPKAIPKELLTRARRMRSAGRSLRQIASTLGVARSTLARELRA